MIRKTLILCVVVACFVIAGTMDAEDAARDLAATCEMIEAGVWPAEVEPSCKNQ